MSLESPPYIARLQRIDSTFGDFLAADKFIDLILLSGPNKYPCHRLVLANTGKWFLEQLQNPIHERSLTNTEPVRLDLPENPGGRFQLFLDLVYQPSRSTLAPITIAPEDVPFLLKISVFYRAKKFRSIFRFLLREYSHRAELLSIVRELGKLGLTREALPFVPQLVDGLKRILARKDNLPFKLPDFLSAVSPGLFAAVINNDAFNPEETQRDDIVLKLTNEFYAVFKQSGGVLTREDRKALGSTVKWLDLSSDLPVSAWHRSLFARYRCEWLPPEITLYLQKALLTSRRKMVRSFKAKVPTDVPKLSRWFSSAWLWLIQAGKMSAVPAVPVLRFIQTLGHQVDPIDPDKFGLLKVKGRGQFIGKIYGPQKIFEPGRYFLALANGNEPPAVEIDFYNACVTIDVVKWETKVPEKVRNTPAYKAPKLAPKPEKYKVAVRWGIGNLDGSSVTEEKEVKLAGTDAKATRLAIEFPDVKQLVKGGPAVEAPVARLQEVEVEGYFNQ